MDIHGALQRCFVGIENKEELAELCQSIMLIGIIGYSFSILHVSSDSKVDGKMRPSSKGMSQRMLGQKEVEIDIGGSIWQCFGQT